MFDQLHAARRRGLRHYANSTLGFLKRNLLNGASHAYETAQRWSWQGTTLQRIILNTQSVDIAGNGFTRTFIKKDDEPGKT